MTKDEVLKAVLGSPSLPTLPTVAYKLISISERRNWYEGYCKSHIKDTSLSAKVLKIAIPPLQSSL